eukprot:jgi/Botrbrau1/17557/Bobra.0166s0005.1
MRACARARVCVCVCVCARACVRAIYANSEHPLGTAILCFLPVHDTTSFRPIRRPPLHRHSHRTLFHGRHMCCVGSETSSYGRRDGVHICVYTQLYQESYSNVCKYIYYIIIRMFANIYIQLNIYSNIQYIRIGQHTVEDFAIFTALEQEPPPHLQLHCCSNERAISTTSEVHVHVLYREAQRFLLACYV